MKVQVIDQQSKRHLQYIHTIYIKKYTQETKIVTVD